MAISTVAGLVTALETPNLRQKFLINKASAGTAVPGFSSVYFRVATLPVAAAVHTAAQTCNHLTVGAVPYTLPLAGKTAYISRLTMAGTSAATLEVHDRLAHVAGFSGILITAQTVGLNLNTLSATDNIAQRIVSSDYSKVQWAIEVLTQLGTTATTATVSYTNHLGAAKTTTVAIPASARGNVLYPISPASGDFIRSVESITLAATTGTAGNFGVVATVQRGELTLPPGVQSVTYEWPQIGLPQVYDSSCLTFIVNIAVSNGTIAFTGSLTLVQG